MFSRALPITLDVSAILYALSLLIVERRRSIMRLISVNYFSRATQESACRCTAGINRRKKSPRLNAPEEPRHEQEEKLLVQVVHCQIQFPDRLTAGAHALRPIVRTRCVRACVRSAFVRAGDSFYVEYGENDAFFALACNRHNRVFFFLFFNSGLSAPLFFSLLASDTFAWFNSTNLYVFRQR